MNIWFTSDTHANHAGITGPELSKWKSGYRTFKTVQQMNECLIETNNDERILIIQMKNYKMHL